LRLSALVNQRGVDAFTFDDFLFVGGKVSLDPSRLILVGGQALETWGVVFDVLAPTGDRHPLTEDADWLGGKKDAQWLCDLLGKDTTELQLASVDEVGPSSAIAFHKRPDGRILLIDFLHTIVGPSSDDVRRLAVPIQVGGANPITLHVMHPLLCLASRLHNLKTLESKRRGNGPMQAQWAISIVEAFITRTIAQGDLRQAQKACQKVAEQAEYQAGPFCYLEFRLDPLLAVTPAHVQAIGGRFATEEWPRTVERIEQRRERRRRAAALRAEQRGQAKPS
jgi:hypothetical protein